MVDRSPVTILGIDHVQVAAPRGCEAEARAFYGGLLGLEELPKPETLRGARRLLVPGRHRASCTSASRSRSPRRARRIQASSSTTWPPWPIRLRAEGIEVTPDETIPDVERAYVADPFGNRLELRQG